MNTIHNFSASLIQRTKQAGRYSTSGIYTSTVNSFFRFIGHRSITFADLTPTSSSNTKTGCSAKGGAIIPYPPICVCSVPSLTKLPNKAFHSHTV